MSNVMSTASAWASRFERLWVRACARSGSPIEPTQPLDQVEMSVSAQDGKGMLPAERRNPNVVGRDRGASLFELTTKLGVPDRGLFTDLEHVADRNHLLQPTLVLTLMSRMGD